MAAFGTAVGSQADKAALDLEIIQLAFVGEFVVATVPGPPVSTTVALLPVVLTALTRYAPAATQLPLPLPGLRTAV
jgi:hypothetical protein